MPSDTSLTVPTRYVETEGIRFAYRRWGKSGGAPLVFLNYFSGNLDDWDPQVTDSLAAEYESSCSTMPGSRVPAAKRREQSRRWREIRSRSATALD
jgi:pimeloyl-ACP methyl ester carboxylesterase